MSEVDDKVEQLEGEDLDALRALPRFDVGAKSAEQIRRRAHAELERGSQRARRPAHWMRRVYRRAEPVLAGAIAASYLVWAFGAVLP